MKRIILATLCLFILSGCTSQYELKIDGDQFNETITTYIYSGDREYDMSLFEGTLDYGDRIGAFMTDDSYPFFQNYDFVYDKKVEKIADYEKVQLKYKYTAEEFKKSNAINLCFQQFQFNEEKDRYIINLSGYFYCLYNNESLDIMIETKNEVFQNNADEVNNNKYIWHITKENFKDVEISLNLSKNKSKGTVILISIVLSIVIGFIITFLILSILKKKSKANQF